MLTVQEALDAILREVRPLQPRTVPLDDALGLVLAQEVRSDVDSPPFDKALMDGYAVQARDLSSTGGAVLRVIEEVAAGQVPTRSVGPGEAVRIMTGAPLPAGADCVVPIERTQSGDTPDKVHITSAGRPGANILPRGSVLRAGALVMSPGRQLRPQELGALAELGRHELLVCPRPRVAALATGDELVPVAQIPGPGQIRNSNEVMLTAQIRRAGGEPQPLGIARDELSHLSQKVAAGLSCEVLLISGGVSAGKRDLVPSVLAAAGVRQVFHKVDVRPGKPLWFGVKDSTGQAPCYVFGLPGNPVSSMVCFELFVRTALRRLMGIEPALPPAHPARLTQPHTARGERPTYHPAQLETDAAGNAVVRLVAWQGSSDLQSTVNANGMAVLPAGEKEYAPGDVLNVISW